MNSEVDTIATRRFLRKLLCQLDSDLTFCSILHLPTWRQPRNLKRDCCAHAAVSRNIVELNIALELTHNMDRDEVEKLHIWEETKLPRKRNVCIGKCLLWAMGAPDLRDGICDALIIHP